MIKTKAILLGLSLFVAGINFVNANSLVETTAIEVNDEHLNEDRKDVTNTIKTHLRGIKEGKIALIKSAWLKSSASITEINNGRAINRNIDKSFALWAKEATPNLNEKIISVQLTSKNVAVAQISLSWQGETYKDTLTLIKTKEGWKIISKIYNAPVLRQSAPRKFSGGYGG